MNKYKAVLFDMDGVLFDSENITSRIFPEVVNSLGYNMKVGTTNNFLGLTYNDTAEKLKHMYGEDFPFDKVMVMVENKLVELAKEGNMPKKAYVEQTIKLLRKNGILTAVSSSNNEKSVKAYLKYSGLDILFDTVLSGKDVDNGKPDPEIFLKTAARLKVEPKECIVVEDSLNGVKAAKTAGMYSVMVPDLLPFEEKFYPYVDKCYNEIKEILNLFNIDYREE